MASHALPVHQWPPFTWTRLPPEERADVHAHLGPTLFALL